MFGGIFLIFLGFPVSIIVSVVFKIKKRKALVPVLCIPISLVLGLAFISIGTSLYGQTDEYKESVTKKERSELEQVEESKNQEEYIRYLEERLENAEKETQAENTENEQESALDPITAQEISVEEKTQELACDFTYKNMTVKYLNHEVMVDGVGQTVLVVYYEFTNNNKENKTFDYSFSDTCFQNGVEVEHSYWHANDESKNSGKEIKTGTTITVASSFVLGDSRDDVELEITPWIGNKILFEKTLKLE